MNSKFVKCGVALGLLLLMSVGFAESAVAEDCNPRQPADLGDDYYMCDNGWQCQQQYVDYWWSAFDFDSTWTNTFGYNDHCNNAKALARTFNALYALGYSSTNSPSCNRSLSNVSQWSMCYAAEEINKLKADLGNSDSPYARTSGRTVTLYSYFWGQSVPARAGTIFHEARHADGCNHNASDSSCVRRESCDKSWENGCPAAGNDSGANRYQVTFLNWYALTAFRITPALRQSAVNRANEIIDTGYRDVPCFDINSQGAVVSNGCN